MQRNIRILHVLHAFSAGGLENGIVNVINRSPGHLEHELCFLSRGGEFLNRLNRPVVYHELNKRNSNDVGLIFKLRELFTKRSFDIIHTRNWGGMDGVLAACFTRKPAVIHGEHGRDIADPRGENRRRNLARRTLSFRTKRFVAVSRDLYRWLLTTVQVPEQKLVFIPNGVDTERFRPGRDLGLRQSLGIADDEFVVGSVGRLDPIKNHPGLVNAVRMVNGGPQKVRLLVVGEGPARLEIEGLLGASAIEPRPLLLGYSPDVERYYRLFDAFVLNSFAEGMSNTLLEAMAFGLPVICTNVGGNVELVQDRRTGRLIPSGDDRSLADAISECAASRDAHSTFGTNARQFILQHFSLDRMVQQYVGLYESVA